MNIPKMRFHRAVNKAVVSAALACALCSPALGVNPPLADAPLASMPTATVKPNLMLILDTSGSMAWGHMPDDEEFQYASAGYKNYLCNSLYYNPNVQYLAPKKFDGTNYPNSTFGGAYFDGYLNTATTVNLGSNYIAYDNTTSSGHNSDTAQPAYYYLYPGSLPYTYNTGPCVQAAGTKPATFVPPPLAGTAPKAPTKPSAVAITVLATATGSLFTASDAGNYKYQVTAVSTAGESAPSTISSTVAIASGNGIQLVITDGGVPSGAPASTAYRIYRTAKGGSITGFVLEVARASSGNTTVVDLKADVTGDWTRVLVGATSGPGSTDERQNFANWYSYYRTRILMMKSATTRAFDQLNDSYRLGFIIINPGSTIGTTDFLPIGDFTSGTGGQRDKWYSILTSQTVGNSTPLREALARVGRYYAGKNDGINTGMIGTGKPDPVQYSCQQNFSILTTDGYWNTGDETVGPVGLDGTTLVGNQDNNLSLMSQDIFCVGTAGTTNCTVPQFNISPRPMWDGATTGTRTRTELSNSWQYGACTALQTRTTQIQKKTVVAQSRTTQLQQRTNQLQVAAQQLQLATQQLQVSTTQLYVTTQTATETHVDTTRYYYAQHTERCNNNNNPCSPSSWTANTSYEYSGSPQPATGTWACGSRRCRVIVAEQTPPSFTAPYTGWTVGACPADNNGVHYECRTVSSAPSAPAPVTGSCPANTATRTYTCTLVPAATPAFTAPLYTGWTQVTSGTTCPAPAAGTINTCQTTAATPYTDVTTQATCPAKSNLGETVTCRQNPAAQTYADLTTSGICPTAANPGQTVACRLNPAAPSWVNLSATTCPGAANAGQTVACRTVTGAWANASACTPVTTPNASGQTVECQTLYNGQTTDNGFVAQNPSPACVPSGPTVGKTVTCQAIDSGWVNAPTCSNSAATSGNGWTTTTCQNANPSAWVTVATCTPSTDAAGVNTECSSSTNSGYKVQYKWTKTPWTASVSGTQLTSAETQGTATAGSWTDLDGACYYPTNTAPALPVNGPWQPTLPAPWTAIAQPPAPPTGCTAWPCLTYSSGTAGGASNTLADVAMYYYRNDLRSTLEDNVPSGGSGPEDDQASWQHMTTFTMGLGVPGILQYREDYKTATTGDFAGLRAGTTLSNGGTGWPVPAADSASALDDLWHAAANGRGQFFSARDPDSVISGLNTALANIKSRVSSAAAAATSNLEPVNGDNFVYTPKYVTQKWTGELEAHTIDLSTGLVSTSVFWSAAGLLDAKTGMACDNRKIYLFRSGATNNLVNLTWNTYACDSNMLPTGSANTGLNSTEQAYFSKTNAVQDMTQWVNMTDGSSGTVDQRTAAADDKLVNYVRGQRGYEGFVTNSATGLYREREHVLGDIVNAQPVYARAPFANYAEATNAGYTAFKASTLAGGGASDRAPMLYVASNDGMLHAFYAGSSQSDTNGGKEAWAFMPSIVLADAHDIADSDWADKHHFSVDGTPTVGDVYDSSAGVWKTVLVAGLNKGGKGYYALDVTNPDPTTTPAGGPKALWQFQRTAACYDTAVPSTATQGGDCHVGYTYGNPLISKLGTRWVVFLSSGYENDDGIGYLYTLDAITGEILSRISTGTVGGTSPRGMGKMNLWGANTAVNNVAQFVYGVDLGGNVWRFDINGTLDPTPAAALIATVKDSGGTAQPITTIPELDEVAGRPFVFVATGRLLGADDITTTGTQSIYGIFDPRNATGTAYANLRTSLKQMTITQVGGGASATRTINCTTNCGTSNGWYVDLPDSGERVNVDMALQLGTLVIASNVPQNTACTVGGYSWLNYLNYATGTAVSTSANGSVGGRLSDSLAVGLNVVRLPGGKTVVITTTSDAKQTTVSAPFDTPGPSGKRISWRELSQ